MRAKIPAEYAVLFGVLLLAVARAYVLERVTKRPGKNGCWVWKGWNDGRYGNASFLGMKFKAHRLAYLAFVGPIRGNRVVDHKDCDNPPCCRPAHLLAVTQSANIKRCFDVGRGRSPFLTHKDML